MMSDGINFKSGPSKIVEIDLQNKYVKILKEDYPEKFLQLVDKPCDMSKISEYIEQKNIQMEDFSVIDFLKCHKNNVGDVYFNTTKNKMMVFSDKHTWLEMM